MAGATMVDSYCDCARHAPATRKSGALCARCGGRIPSDDMTETMLETLAQLARFGLDAEGLPLLERRAEDRS
jgi:hypothetical protein